MKLDQSKLNVCHKLCDQCLYSKNKIVSDERKEELLQSLQRSSYYFVCHKASILGVKVMCRGYYEANQDTSTLIALEHELELVNFVDLSKYEKESSER